MQLLRTDHPQTSKAIGLSAPAQFFKTRQLVSVGRNDDFSAHFVRNSVLTAELNHGRRPADAQPSLQGARLVVNAGVDDTAIVSALVAGNAVFLFKKQ
jgi:hypothetical protein